MLPDVEQVKLGRYAFSSPIRLIQVDISKEPALAMAIFDAWSVPEEERLTPIAMAGSYYYRGTEAITWLTRYHIKNGDSLHTPLITLDDTQDTQAISPWSSALAGLVAGFNPCALSMLLLFLGLMLNLRRSVSVCGSIFLASKFVCYLMIGTILLRLLQRVNLAWINPLTRILMTVLGIPLIILNIHDAWMAYHQHYGQVRNQLPSKIRNHLNRFIERVSYSEHRWFPLAVALLGVLVALGEFLCAGQIYLAEVLALVDMKAFSGLINLVVYCLCFIMPSVFVMFLVACGMKKFTISNGLRRYMPVIKLANALFFIVALIWIW